VRIAVLSYSLPVDGQKRGGIERVAHDLADGLARRGHEVTVFTYDAKPEGASYETRVLPWKKFVNSWLGRRLTMGYLGNLLALVPSYRGYDLIMAHGDSLLLPVLGKTLIRVVHGSALGEAITATSPWRFLMQLGVYLQELLTGLTQSGCVAVSQNTLKSNPFVRRVISNGVDLSLFYPDAYEKSPEPSILFVGDLNGRKRGRRLLEWFITDVQPKHPTARLRVVSNPGPQTAGVSYHTGISNAELARMYRAAWVYASPSTYEGFGLPYVEAMASGTPIIATPNAGSREVLADGEYGLIVEDRKFAEALTNLLSDSNSRERLIARGICRAQEYSLDSTIDQYEELLTKMIRTPRQIRQSV
jgi:glycosyltransferase involved in cell wall biosynthesis